MIPRFSGGIDGRKYQATAALVTTGRTTSFEVVLASLTGAFEQVVVWDNSRRQNILVLGRYHVLAEARFPVTYTQDDDCLVDVDAVMAGYDPAAVTVNMPAAWRPAYPDGIALVGFGAVFLRDQVRCAFDRYQKAGFPLDELFQRECDRVFTGLNTIKLLDVPFTHMLAATGEDRMYREPRHQGDLLEIRRRIHFARESL